MISALGQAFYSAQFVAPTTAISPIVFFARERPFVSSLDVVNETEKYRDPETLASANCIKACLKMAYENDLITSPNSF